MNLIIIGPQGCGKGTQALKLAEKYGLAVIEMGHLFRAIAKENSELGRMIDDVINKKKELVSDEIAIEVFKDSLRKISENQGVILDGIPRTMIQVKLVEEVMADLGRNIDKVIAVELPSEISMERITRRFSCKNCHKRLIMGVDVKNIKNVCPSCGGEIYQRSDDSPEGVSKRLGIYYKETVPVIEYYRSKGILVEVDGKGSIGEVFNEITERL